MSDLVLMEDAEYVLRLVKKICTEVGPGCPGSLQERTRGMAFKHELDDGEKVKMLRGELLVRASTAAPTSR